MMAIRLKDKFDSLLEKAFPQNNSAPVRPRQQQGSTQRVSYSEQLSDSTGSETQDTDDNNNDSDSSQSSFEQPKKKVVNKNGQRRANASATHKACFYHIQLQRLFSPIP